MARHSEQAYLSILTMLGRRVAELRQGRGWTQEIFAERAVWSVKYVQRIEGWRANLSVRSLTSVAAYLSVNVGDLFAQPALKSTTRGRPPKHKLPNPFC